MSHRFRKFGNVINVDGPTECSDPKILSVFIKLSNEERKLVMGAGSITAFLTMSPHFIVEKNVVRERTAEEK